jgi:UrcA family protein
MTLAPRYASANRALLTALTACVLVAAAAAARAGSACPEETVSAVPAGTAAIRVNYADLNLATDAGTRVLFQRIHAAAHKVCAVSDIRDLDGLAADRSCEQAAVSQAVQQVHSAQLAALNARTEQRG